MANPVPSPEPQAQALDLVNQARGALKAGAHQTAEQQINAALELAPDCLPAIELHGVLAGLRGDLPAAAEAFERITQHRPDSPGAWFNLAKCRFDSGQIDAAGDSLQRALALDPEMADALALHGLVLRAQERGDEAIETLQAALAKAPDHLAAATALASQLEAKGDADAALKWFERAVKIQPGVPHTHYNLGETLLRRGELEAASDALHHALTLDHRFDDARLALAHVARQRGDLEEAISLCRRVVRKRPGSLAATHNLVGLLLAGRKLGELQTLLEQSTSALGDSPWLALWRAQLDARRGRSDAARDALQALRLSSCPPLDAALIDEEIAALPESGQR